MINKLSDSKISVVMVLFGYNMDMHNNIMSDLNSCLNYNRAEHTFKPINYR